MNEKFKQQDITRGRSVGAADRAIGHDTHDGSRVCPAAGSVLTVCGREVFVVSAGLSPGPFQPVVSAADQQQRTPVHAPQETPAAGPGMCIAIIMTAAEWFAAKGMSGDGTPGFA